MSFSFLAAFLLVRHVKKYSNKTHLYSKWSGLLTVAFWSVIVLFVVSISWFNDGVQEIIGGLTLLGLVAYINQEHDFKNLRPFAYTHLPLMALTIVYGLANFLVPSKYENWHTYFQFAILGAFVWIFARGATFIKQQKEVEIITGQKAELEMLVAERTAELTRQKNELQEAVKELNATQAQLIQQEKLASLGELTAGIAHEIQNPLNFVNNFSEVSSELLDEMEEELTKGDTEEAIAIATDIKQNLEKIRHHGKRADDIVKGMLQHSRASTGQKEPTHINALADEYLRLAYHGLRAKDKTFNAELITQFDKELPLVNVISQDVGRVLLNLFTNAFYAVQQKQKTAGAGYKPTVEVNTKAQGRHVLITVKDNGTGIPEQIRDKIMQPFFTTKPTGEGTGLGLSLSYDIIVKGHGGKIEIESEPDAGAEFTITLPIA